MNNNELERLLSEYEQQPILDARTKFAGIMVVVLAAVMLAIAIYGYCM